MLVALPANERAKQVRWFVLGFVSVALASSLTVPRPTKSTYTSYTHSSYHADTTTSETPQTLSTCLLTRLSLGTAAFPLRRLVLLISLSSGSRFYRALFPAEQSTRQSQALNCSFPAPQSRSAERVGLHPPLSHLAVFCRATARRSLLPSSSARCVSAAGSAVPAGVVPDSTSNDWYSWRGPSFLYHFYGLSWAIASNPSW